MKSLKSNIKTCKRNKLPYRKSSDSFLIKQDKIAHERVKLHNEASDIIRNSHEKFEALDGYISQNNAQELNNKIKEITALLDEVRTSMQDNSNKTILVQFNRECEVLFKEHILKNRYFVGTQTFNVNSAEDELADRKGK